jgi:hypothetical protein
MSNRTTRIREYADPGHSPWRGQNTQQNLDHWAARATENSRLAPRAKSGEVKLPSTGEVRTHSTSGTRSGDVHAYAKNNDLNHNPKATDFYAKVKRQGS